PRQGYLYIFDREIAPIGITFVIGMITIQIETTEEINGIDIYIDNELKFTDFTYPYSRLWNERVIGRHVIRVTEHGGDESDEVSVFIFNFAMAKPSVVINEIMSDPKGSDAGKEWIELYNKGDSIRIKGWTISNANGNAIATLPNWVFPNDSYLVINFGNGNNDNDFSDGNGTFYVGSNQEFLDNNMDECALYTGEPSENTIIDFISYCYEGNYTSGIAYEYATKAGIWNDGEYFNPSKQIQDDSITLLIEEEDSIGRDSYSNDTNMPTDWNTLGGKDAFKASPGRCNFDAFGIVDMEMQSQIGMADKKKWTIMFYMAADSHGDRLEETAVIELNQLEKVGSDENINIVFEIDGRNKVGRAITVHFPEEDWVGVEDKGMTFRGYLKKDDRTGYVKLVRRGENRWFTQVKKSSLIYAWHRPNESATIGEVNTGTAAPLTDFINWAKRNVPAEHYVLILAGHGKGWKGVLRDYTSNKDWLYMHELKDALSDANVMKFDIIGFDACLMGTVEVGYQIRQYANYMVASEEIEWCWNFYDKLFKKLQDNPDISPENFSKLIVEQYGEKRRESHRCSGNYYTLSAIDLGPPFLELVQSLDKLSIHLKEGMEDWGDTELERFKEHYSPNDNCQMDVKKILWNTEFYCDKNYIDLYDFIFSLACSSDINTYYKEGASSVVNAIDEVVIAEEHGDSHLDSNGISIYFPRNQTLFGPKHNCCQGYGNLLMKEDPFDYPSPSRLINHASSLAIYAEDHTTQWGKAPYIGNTPHPWPEAINLLFRMNTHWDEFLHRYYKPCADAGENQTIFIPQGQPYATVTLDGSGSSSADDNTSYLKYFWDFDDRKDDSSGNKIPQDDMDADGIDETNDDNDSMGIKVTHEFAPGTYVVTLTIWDDHHTINDRKTNSTKNTHWKTDQDTCIIRVIELLDEEPPIPKIITPEDGTTTANDIIIVTGNATDDVGIKQFGYTLKWKDGETSDSWELDNLTSYEFEFEVELHENWNEITVWAKDYAGNEGNDSVVVYYYPEEDTTPPVTIEEVGQPSWEGGYRVSSETPIWLNATDDLSGVASIYYEVWSDEDGDDNVDTMKANATIPASSVEIHFGEYEVYGIAELHFYATDNSGNVEEMKVKQHYVES
ncbi:MAG: lamin tail domain-containing protein, partial [Thermoplasmata archaeon]|nr:lamin tail domain-containing protein [Thermoplasmata archaeon]